MTDGTPPPTWEPRWLKLERIRQDKNQADVADAAGLALGTVSNAERSPTADMSTIVKIIEALGTSFGQLEERYA